MMFTVHLLVELNEIVKCNLLSQTGSERIRTRKRIESSFDKPELTNDEPSSCHSNGLHSFPLSSIPFIVSIPRRKRNTTFSYCLDAKSQHEPKCFAKKKTFRQQRQQEHLRQQCPCIFAINREKKKIG